MEPAYNDIAGRDRGRLAALTDGIFAFAMTLLVLDLHVPMPSEIHSEAALWSALVALAPRLLTALMTFLTLGIFWVGEQTHMSLLKGTNRDLAWIHIAFMFGVVLMPFSTALLSAFITYRVALLIYWLNILFLGAMLYASYGHAVRHSLVRDSLPIDLRSARARILWAQGLYAVGAALCWIDTYVSIAFILLVQLNYAIAPRIRFLYRL